ncbi:hypothetical protein IWW54_001468 [Coemansia sp. RSA 2705]|nr:hypothetical protein IWW54_001468 [Coemansia sp. RSA 2705]
MVYKTAEITYGNVATTTRIVSPHSLVDEPVNLNLKTNVSLAIATNCTTHIHHLYIRINHLANPFPGIFSIMAFMHQASCCWPHVQKLDLAIKGNFTLAKHINSLATYYAEELLQAAGSLATMMPNVAELSFGDAHPTSIAHVIYGNLAAAHAHRLTLLKSSCPLACSSLFVFTSLTHLDMTLSSNSTYQLPLICADTLVHLSLTNVPLDFDWLPFVSPVPQTTVVFGSLKALIINYSNTYIHNNVYTDDEQSRNRLPLCMRKLCFPLIECLSIMAPGTYYPMLDCSEFPWKISSLHLDGSVRLVHQLDKLHIPAIGQLSLNLIFDDSHDISVALSAINEICSRATCTSTVRLEVYNHQDICFSEKSICTYITELDIKATISSGHVLKIIQTLPNLSKLELAGIQFASGDSSCKSVQARALQSRISVLTIINCISSAPDTGASEFIQMLLLQLSLLSVVNLHNMPIAPIQEFISQHQQQYPHLANIELNVK